MRRSVLLLALCLVGTAPGLAFDAESQAVIDRMKAGKLVPISGIATLMMGAERWCYRQQGDECAWSDIYLSVDETGASYEISNPWSQDVDISFVDAGIFRDDRYICEAGTEWISSVRAYSRDDGLALEGRELHALKAEIAQVSDGRDADCFDYLYQAADSAAQTVTLLQRQHRDGVTDPANDAIVTLHFDKDTAEGLGWYW
ncbi:MAG: hypothetical protein ABS75_16825 [Pelagibacterium sp. SCN 63-23]|nr:MAG: hypothetical protein ABS75_16825 [Pelagibacterium sp. SCN 63-23]